MQVTISKAAKMAGVSRATIYNDIDSGTLSVERGVKDRKMVNISELERVYKTLKNPDSEDNKAESKTVKNSNNRQENKKSSSTDQVAVLQERLEAQKAETEYLEKLLEKEQDERNRERESAKQFEEYFKTQIDNQAESIKNFTRLIEDKRGQKDNGAGDWGKSMKAVEARISNQEKESKETKEKAQKILRQNQILKKKLEEEKNKSFWQKLFG